MSKGRILNIPRRFVLEEWGGTETVITETTRNLIANGYDAEIVTTLALSNKKEEVIFGIPVKRFGYTYTRLGLNGKNRLLLDKRGGNMFSLSLFLHILFAKDLKVIHLHTMGRIGALARLAARLRGVSCVVSIHGGLLDLPQALVDKMMEPIRGSFNWGKPLDILFRTSKVIEDADAVICVGQSERTKISEVHPDKKVVYIPNGVDIQKFRSGSADAFREKNGLSPKDRIILCVSGFYPQKNQTLLLDAFAEARKILPDLKLVMIGVAYDRDYHGQLERKTEEIGLRESVLFLTDIRFDDPTLVDAYAAADLFVLPSQYESFGIVILEAWAAETPALCGNVGGLPSFVKDGENGLFFDVNSSEDLCRKILKLLQDDSLYRNIKRNASQSVMAYSWESITAKLADLYREVAR